tara:strand:+ start:336 stop:854 length:519 start_codon:yes stop_codon:yes gene_type:complete
MKKNISWIFSLLFVLGPLFSGCGIFHPPLRDGDGYYPLHFYCCGSTAIENAFIEYYKREGTDYDINSKQISKEIQDDGIFLKRLLSLFDNQVICSTWSWEIRGLVKKYGFELINIDKFENLDPSRDIAFVLVRGKFFSKEWHWMCYPVDKDVKTFFGAETKIDKILLLKKIK